MKGQFALEFTNRTARLYRMEPVPGATYLAPGDSLTIPVAIWSSIIKVPVKAGETAFFNFTPAQLAAHGVAPDESHNSSA
jgi:hypothetical protein